MQETVFFQGPALLVSSTRLDIAGQTFAVRNIVSVRVDGAQAPVIALAMLALCLVAGAVLGGWGWWLAAGVYAVWAWRKLRRHTLVLVTGGGEQVALVSADVSHLEALRDAIAQAIAVR